MTMEEEKKYRHPWKENLNHTYMMYAILKDLEDKDPVKEPSDWNKLADICAKKMNQVLDLKEPNILNGGKIVGQTLNHLPFNGKGCSKSSIRGLKAALDTGYLTPERLARHLDWITRK